MKKIVTILGARPQFVKAAVLSRIICQRKNIEEVIIHTGQHYDTNMSALFFEEMEIPTPKFNLEINGGSHGAMTGQMLEELEKILMAEKPHAVVVYGDTNSTLAGALASKKLDIKLIHIEAGLRSFNMKMPEEINRILTDRIADLLLCPTDTALHNLANEGFDNLPAKVVKCGDIMKDAVEHYSLKSENKSNIIDHLNLAQDEFVLATIHRQENTDDIEKLKRLLLSFKEIGRSKKVVLPLHPRTKKILDAHKLSYDLEIIPPVGYLDMLALLKNCNLVVTDSGGLQKEAYFNKKFCIIIRDETEWVELCTNGFAKVVGSDSRKILEAFVSFQNTKADFSMNLYGNHVGEEIHKAIVALLET